VRLLDFEPEVLSEGDAVELRQFEEVGFVEDETEKVGEPLDDGTIVELEDKDTDALVDGEALELGVHDEYIARPAILQTVQLGQRSGTEDA